MSERTISDPMSFLYLDLLANVLLHEIADMERDFNNKMSFLREQERNTLENAKNIITIDDFLDILRKCIFKMEIELRANERGLVDAEKIVVRLERELSKPDIGQSRLEPLQSYTYDNLLKLLLSADQSTMQCACLKNEIEEFNHEVMNKMAPAKMISNIIDYHNKSLELLERQITQLECHTKDLKMNFDEISKNLDISSLSTNLDCQMAKEIMDVNTNYQIFK